MECEMNLGEWVSVFTNIITASTAVIMALLAYQTYLRKPEQEPEPEDEVAPNETESILKQITVFKTSKQETLLKITEQGLECYLDDSRPNKGGHQWTIGKTEVKTILESSNFEINPGYKVSTGTFTIGRRRNWLYSKNLFPDPEYLKSIIKDMLKRVIR